MKKLLTLITALLISLSVFSQTSDATLFRCTSATIYNSLTEETVTNETDFIIKVDIKNSKITFDNNQKSVYYIRYISIDNEPHTDENGDDYTLTSFKAYDEESIDCVFSIIIYDELDVVYFSATYSDITVFWQVENL